MPDPSLFPMFMNPLGGGTGTGGGEIVVTLLADPEVIVQEVDIVFSLESDNISVEVNEDIEIEVED